MAKNASKSLHLFAPGSKSRESVGPGEHPIPDYAPSEYLPVKFVEETIHRGLGGVVDDCRA